MSDVQPVVTRFLCDLCDWTFDRPWPERPNEYAERTLGTHIASHPPIEWFKAYRELRAAADRLADAAFQVADEQIWIGQAVGRRHRYVNALVEWRLAALHSALAAYRKLKGDEASE